MDWNDLPDIDQEFHQALLSFDWSRVHSIVGVLVARIPVVEGPFPLLFLRRFLRGLRRKRRYFDLLSFCRALLASPNPQNLLINRDYVQALIESGDLNGAEDLLKSLLASMGTPAPGEMESIAFYRGEFVGLLGRIAKQRYINASKHGLQPDREHLQRAFRAYLEHYVSDRSRNLWHGINAVALLGRAERDGVDFKDAPSRSDLARQILAILHERELTSFKELEAWDIATAMEAHVALGDVREAVLRALQYAGACDADAFEVASTLRQMEEVWGLRDADDDETGSRILPVLKGALLRRGEFTVPLSGSEVSRGREKNYGDDRFNTLSWYKTGLDRCESICRIDRLDGVGFGTGSLVSSADFFPSLPARKLVLTNSHVVNPNGAAGALQPGDARARFEVINKTFDIARVFWHRHPDECDAAFLELDGETSATSMPVYGRVVEMRVPAARVYIIGHPEGKDLRFSLQDNHLIACNERLLQYRTPTKPGSSGSPVFEDFGWQLIGLHYWGDKNSPSLTEEGKFCEANQGITMTELRTRTRQSPP